MRSLRKGGQSWKSKIQNQDSFKSQLQSSFTDFTTESKTHKKYSGKRLIFIFDICSIMVDVSSNSVLGGAVWFGLKIQDLTLSTCLLWCFLQCLYCIAILVGLTFYCEGRVWTGWCNIWLGRSIFFFVFVFRFGKEFV